MSVIIIMIAISFLVAASFLLAFVWASSSGQFDDDYTPSIRILFDDEPKQTTNGNNSSSSKGK